MVADTRVIQESSVTGPEGEHGFAINNVLPNREDRGPAEYHWTGPPISEATWSQASLSRPAPCSCVSARTLGWTKRHATADHLYCSPAYTPIYRVQCQPETRWPALIAVLCSVQAYGPTLVLREVAPAGRPDAPRPTSVVRVHTRESGGGFI